MGFGVLGVDSLVGGHSLDGEDGLLHFKDLIACYAVTSTIGVTSAKDSINDCLMYQVMPLLQYLQRSYGAVPFDSAFATDAVEVCLR